MRCLRQSLVYPIVHTLAYKSCSGTGGGGGPSGPPSIITDGLFTNDAANQTTSPFANSVTPRAGNNRLALGVAALESGSASANISGMLWNDVAFTELGRTSLLDTGFRQLVFFWMPDTDFPSIAQDVDITYSQTPNNNAIVAVLQLEDARQAAPDTAVFDEQATGTNITLTPTVVANDSFVFGIGLSNDEQGLVVDGPANSLATFGADNDFKAVAGSIIGNPASASMSFTRNNSVGLAGAFAVRPA